jgi:hypothetical protein
MRILPRFAAAILVAAALSSAFPGWPQAQPPPGWLPPGLSNEERYLKALGHPVRRELKAHADLVL